MLDWVKDLYYEVKTYSISCWLMLSGQQDPVRKTAKFPVTLLLLLKRALLQRLSCTRSIAFDMFLNFGCGFFISLVTRSFDYLGSQPDGVCTFAPVQLKVQCNSQTDSVSFLGIFCCLGAMYAGISGGSTFSDDCLVFYRDSSAGMSGRDFYIGKALADIPRIVVSSCLYFLTLTYFVQLRASLSVLYFVILLLYLNAFAMGYLLSIIVRKQILALACTGFAMAWSLAISGIVPSLPEVWDSNSSIAWLWEISPPRWAMEAIWLAEIGARSFTDSKPPERPGNGYEWEDFDLAFIRLGQIALLWHLLALIALKLLNRRRLK